MNSNTILVADDQEISRVLISELFENEYRVLGASDGQEALDILRRERDSISVVVLDVFMPVMGGYELLSFIRNDDDLKNLPVIIVTSGDSPEDEVKALDAGATDYIRKPIDPRIVMRRVKNIIQQRDLEAVRLENTRLLERADADAKTRYRAFHDSLTGIYNYAAFCEMTAKKLIDSPDTPHVLVRLDIERFKLINSIFGAAAGDRVLMRTARLIRDENAKIGTYCRIQSDHFAFCCAEADLDMARLEELLVTGPIFENEPIKLKILAGIYRIADRSLSVEQMSDRANLAIRSIKDKYNANIAYYDDNMLQLLIREQEIIDEMAPAIKNNEFVPYLQPQYNHITGEIVGAEVLVRWNHPKKGLIPPKAFIPIFERNGFISALDEHMRKLACQILAGWREQGRPMIPLSVNISRVDIYNPRLPEIFRDLVAEYDLSPSLLKVEITESTYMENPQVLIEAVNKFREYGFSVEMDDFGSGYSSLNILKDVPVDTIKLDMNFLAGTSNNIRGGRIVSSIVRMAKYLSLRVVAEGVETASQADYLKEVGCFYVQGFLYSPPVTLEVFNDLAALTTVKTDLNESFFAEILNQNYFWSTDGQASLLFSCFAGPAAIMEYDGTNLEALRVNDKYYNELHISRELYEDVRLHLMDMIVDEDLPVFRDALNMATELRDEVQCTLRWKIPHRPSDVLWLQVRSRLIASDGAVHVLFCAIENITRLMLTLEELEQTNVRMETIIRHVNEGICVFDVAEESHLVYSNEAFFKMLGYTRAQFLSEITDTYGSILPEDKHTVIKNVTKNIKENQPTSFVYRSIRRDGGISHLRAETSCIKHREDGRNYVLAIIEDITVGRQAERNQAVCRNFLSQTGATVLEWDFTNHAFYTSDNFGQYAVAVVDPFDLLLGSSVLQKYVHPEDFACTEKLYENNGASHDRQADFRLLLSGGGYRHCRIIESFSHSKSGKLLRICGIIWPIAGAR